MPVNAGGLHGGRGTVGQATAATAVPAQPSTANATTVGRRSFRHHDACISQTGFLSVGLGRSGTRAQGGGQTRPRSVVTWAGVARVGPIDRSQQTFSAGVATRRRQCRVAWVSDRWPAGSQDPGAGLRGAGTRVLACGEPGPPERSGDGAGVNSPAEQLLLRWPCDERGRSPARRVPTGSAPANEAFLDRARSSGAAVLKTVIRERGCLTARAASAAAGTSQMPMGEVRVPSTGGAAPELAPQHAGLASRALVAPTSWRHPGIRWRPWSVTAGLVRTVCPRRSRTANYPRASRITAPLQREITDAASASAMGVLSTMHRGRS
jgi:hypothetical protein